MKTVEHPFYLRFLTNLVAILLFAGTVGFVLIEKWSVFDGFYMTVVTLSTVGYGETHELSQSGRLFASILIATSVVIITCWTAGITSALVAGDISGSFRRKRERKMISILKDHVIVCGGGVLAKVVIDDLTRRGNSIVVVTNDPKEIENLNRFFPNLLIIRDDPKSELALADANAASAKYLIVAVDSDYENLLITITGKSCSSDLKVLACAQDSELVSRMLKVGADEVICPFVIAGEHVAKLVA